MNVKRVRGGSEGSTLSSAEDNLHKTDPYAGIGSQKPGTLTLSSNSLPDLVSQIEKSVGIDLYQLVKW